MRISYRDQKAMADITLDEFKKRMSYLKNIDKDFDFEKEYQRIGGKVKKESKKSEKD